MTTKVTVSVEGDKRVLVTQGNSSAYVSGRGVSGPKEVEFHLHDPQARKAGNIEAETLTVGAEEDDNGVDGDEAASLA